MRSLDSSACVTRQAGRKLRPRRSRLESSIAAGEALGEGSMVFFIERSRRRDSRVQDAFEHLSGLETDPDADDFAMVWARHELLRCIRAAKDTALPDA